MNMPVKKIFVFGSRALEGDGSAFQMAEILSKKNLKLKFEEVEDPFTLFDCQAGEGEKIIVMDAAGVQKPVQVSILDLKANAKVSLHDFDLSATLQLLEKTDEKKAGKIKIIALPKRAPTNKDVKETLELLKEV